MMSLRHLSAIALCATLLVGCKAASGDAAANGNAATTPPAVSGVQQNPMARTTVPTTEPAPDLTGKTYPLVGDWVPISPQGQTVKQSTNFGNDGRMTTVITGAAKNAKGTVTTKLIQTYKVDGHTITSMPISVNTMATDPTLKQKVDESNKAAADAVKSAKPVKIQVAWKDKDHFSLIIPGAPSKTGQPMPSRTINFKRVGSA